MHFISLYWLTTDFPLWIARPLWLWIASYHDIILTLMYNEIRSQRGQQSILVFQWRLTSEKLNAEIVKDVSNTPSIRIAELRKCATQTTISEWCWVALGLRLNSLCYSSKRFYKLWIYSPMLLYTSGFDILTTNSVSCWQYENDRDLIKAFHLCMQEYVPILVRNVVKLPYQIQ